MIHMRCPRCQDQLSVPESQAGQCETCPGCGNVCAIPGGAAAGPARAVVVNVGAARPAGGLGIASLVMGILACLTAWIPLLGMIALPVAALGLLFGLLGAMISLIGRRSAAGLALAGVVICIAAIALQVAVTSAATRAGMDLLPATMPADIEP